MFGKPMYAKNLIPPQGDWRVVTALELDNADVQYETHPLIGWALSGRNTVVPVFWDGVVIDPYAKASTDLGWTFAVLEPGQELTDDLRVELQGTLSMKAIRALPAAPRSYDETMALLRQEA